MTFRKRHAALAAVTATAVLPAAPAGATVSPLTDQEDAIAPVVRKAVRDHDRAVTRHVRLARTNAKLRGAKPHRERREVRDWSLEHLSDANRALRQRNRKLRRSGATTQAVQTPGHLQAIAACESGGNPGAVDPSGTYRGKYQFDLQTWASVGGSGDPAAAPEAEQDKRAAMLYARSGATPWPVCGS